MNARWFRDNLSVLIFSVLFIAILSGMIWFLRQASAQQATVVQNLEQQQGELRRYQDSVPFPSLENIEVLKHDQTQIKRLFGLMQNAAIRDIAQPPELERDIDFLQLKNVTIARLTATAATKQVNITDGFAWGFSRYAATFPCRNPAAKGEDCKRLLRLLAKQLLIIERLSELLLDSKVEGIQAIRRTEVEPGTSADTLSAPIVDDAKALYRTYPFELEISADTEALRSFLNALAKADNLYVVRAVRITATAHQVRAPVTPTVRRETDLDDHGLTPRAPESPKMIDSRRLNATVRLDVIEFKPPETKPVKR